MTENYGHGSQKVAHHFPVHFCLVKTPSIAICGKIFIYLFLGWGGWGGVGWGGAEAMVEAVSGWGVTSASYPIQKVLDLYGSFNETVYWDYSSWTPDAVVILSGPKFPPSYGWLFCGILNWL